MFRMPWNDKKHEVINAEAPKQSRLKREIKGFVISAIVSFVVVFAILAGRDFIKIQDQYWHDAGVPYPIKEEHILDNYLSFMRFSILSRDSDGFIARWLQKKHYQLYLKIKEKIPDDDPFWIVFWVNATHVPIQDFNENIKRELLRNLELLVNDKSKVKDFNDYQRFWLARCILKRIRFNINYYGIIDIKNTFRLQALKTILPMLNDLRKVKFINDYKPYMKFQEDSWYFVNSVLANYASLLKTRNKISCDKELSASLINNINNYIEYIENKTNKSFFEIDQIKSVKNQYNRTLTIYNQAYKEAGCQN